MRRPRGRMLSGESRTGPPHERAADRFADRVMRWEQNGGGASVDPGAPDGTAGAQRPAPSDDRRIPPDALPNLGGRGRRLPGRTRSFFERRTGHDLGSVRAHTGPAADRAAARLGARAFTFGPDIFFRAGEYRPEMGHGRRLIAHELAHVLQQRAAGTPFIACNDEYIDVFSLDDTRGALRQEARAALLASVEGRDRDADAFADGLWTRLEARLDMDVDQEAVDELDRRIDRLPEITARVADTELDYVEAAQYLTDFVGMPRELAAVYGGPVSYGTGYFVDQVAIDVAPYLLRAFEIYHPRVPPPLLYSDLEQLRRGFRQLTAPFTGPYGVLRLELEGALDALTTVREEFSDAETVPERAALGAEIGRLSRRILLLSDAVEPLRQQLEAGERPEGAGDATVLDQLLAERAGRIDRIRRRARTEEATRSALGDDLELLAGRSVETVAPVATSITSNVRPEEALPETTDAATLDMMRGLADRVEGQREELERLRARVVPPEGQRTYGLDEFERVYGRWFSFYSVRAREADPDYRWMNELYTALFGIFGHVAEGGFARWVLMEQLGDRIGGFLGGAQTDFARRLDRHRPERTEELGGTAGAPEYGYGELLGEARPSEEGERASRTEFLGEAERTSRETFGELGAIRERRGDVGAAAVERGVIHPDDVAARIHLLRDPQARDAWSYLIRSETPPQPGRERRVDYEEKVMPTDVSNYLLAAMQHRATVATPHEPGIGGAAVRSEGVEHGEAASTYRYIEGSPERASGERDETEAMREARRLRGRIGPSGDREGSELRDWRGDVRPQGEFLQRETRSLIRDMEAYLDGFFETRESAEWRIAAILRIGVHEYEVDRELLQHFTPAALLRALAVAGAIIALVQSLRLVPYVGAVLSRAVGKLMERYGLGTDIASLITLAGWMRQAGETSTFSGARLQAYFSRDIMTELGELLQGLAAEAGLRAFAHVPRRTEPPDTVGEIARDLDPVLKSDPEARRIVREEIDAEASRLRDRGAGTTHSSPQLDALESLRLQLETDVSAPDRRLGPAPEDAGSAGRARDATRAEPSREPSGSRAGRAQSARARAEADWERLQSAERPYGGDFNRDQFIERYERGLRFDLETRRWYRAEGTRGRVVRLSDIHRPEGYTEERVQADLERLREQEDAIFDRLDTIRRHGLEGGEISQGRFNILKGNVAEALSMPRQRQTLAEIRNRFTQAELFTNVRARLVREDGSFGPPVQFSDNIIASPVRGNLYIRGVFEVKAGRRGGQEATSQIHRWIERHVDTIDDGDGGAGFILDLPDGRSFRYEPGSTAPGQVVNLARAPRHIITARGSERLGEGSADQVAAPTERIALDQTAREIAYLARRLLDQHVAR